jgi:ankyrin repeat protein/uncharacterized membrane protein YhaH (DUF805 family)
MRSFIARFCHSLTPCRAVFVLVALALSCLGSCGRNHAGSDEIDHAAQMGDVERVKALLKDNPDLIFIRNDQGRTPFQTAAWFGRKDVAEFLLASNADVNAKTNGGDPPLFLAAFNGYTDLAELLLAHRADINITDKTGLTPLLAAASNGYKDIVELLLAYKADVNSRDYRGWTPLHYAAKQGRIDVVKFLLAQKADVNARDDIGWTPLHQASYNGRADVEALLLASGADVNAKANNGATPLHVATSEWLLGPVGQDRNKAAAELLRQHGGGSSEPIDDTEILNKAAQTRKSVRAASTVLMTAIFVLAVVEVLMHTCFRRVRDRRVRTFTRIGATTCAILAVLAGLPITLWGFVGEPPHPGTMDWLLLRLEFAGINTIPAAVGGYVGGLIGRAAAKVEREETLI